MRRNPHSDLPIGTSVEAWGTSLDALRGATGFNGGVPDFTSPSSISVAAIFGDCAATAMALTCTKTAGVAFAPSATTDTTNAGNISTGTIPVARLPLGSASAVGALEVGSNLSVSSGVVSLASAGVTGALGFTPLNKASNLSDLASAASARTNLGLATVASSGSAGDLATGTLPAGRLPAPTASTLGGVESLAATSHQFLTSISTAGVPVAAQPAASDISGLGTYTPWTPAITLGGSATTASAATGSYIQIGKQVIAWFDITLSSLNSHTGALAITGLPPTNNSTLGGAVHLEFVFNAASGLTQTPSGYVSAGMNAVVLNKMVAGTSTQLADTDITANTRIGGMATYYVN